MVVVVVLPLLDDFVTVDVTVVADGQFLVLVTQMDWTPGKQSEPARQDHPPPQHFPPGKAHPPPGQQLVPFGQQPVGQQERLGGQQPPTSVNG